MATKPDDTPVWNALKAHQAKLRNTSLRELFVTNSVRANKLTLSLQGLTADFSKNHLTDETLELLIRLAETQELADRRERMFRGDKINHSENRAVLHTALRTQNTAPITVDGRDIMPDIAALHKRMEVFVNDVREGRWLGATGQKIKHIVNIGIGGSDLGPRLAVNALRHTAKGPQVHFVANVDAAELAILHDLEPAQTLFIVVSKTFTTQETLLNAQTARAWLMAKLGEAAVVKHFVAVSANQPMVEKFGITAANMFPIWDWVGGRFSLWSSVGLSIALAVGWNNFKQLLAGAAVMDEHFRSAPLAQNLPVLLGLVGIWYRNFWGSAGHAILPYSERLRELPRYLQQLEMESNGKSVTLDDKPVTYATAPIVFGECGTVSQHGFHQWLHQGVDVIPTDFIGVRQDDLQQPDHHKVLLANMQAQTEALMQGQQDVDAAWRNPGNRPSTILWLDKLDAFHLGLLLSLYEHKVFVQGTIWNINSFDQWGVELGKKLAANGLKN